MTPPPYCGMCACMTPPLSVACVYVESRCCCKSWVWFDTVVYVMFFHIIFVYIFVSIDTYILNSLRPTVESFSFLSGAYFCFNYNKKLDVNENKFDVLTVCLYFGILKCSCLWKCLFEQNWEMLCPQKTCFHSIWTILKMGISRDDSNTAIVSLWYLMYSSDNFYSHPMIAHTPATLL